MFSIPQDKTEELAKWINEQDEKVAKMQEGSSSLEHLPKPYYGAIGGAYTYSFTPTSIGMVIKVTNGVTKESIDLTDDL